MTGRSETVGIRLACLYFESPNVFILQYVDMRKQDSSCKLYYNVLRLSLSLLLQSSEELRSSVKVLSERVSWLENNQDALVTQVEQCNRYI